MKNRESLRNELEKTREVIIVIILFVIGMALFGIGGAIGGGIAGGLAVWITKILNKKRKNAER